MLHEKVNCKGKLSTLEKLYSYSVCVCNRGHQTKFFLLAFDNFMASF